MWYVAEANELFERFQQNGTEESLLNNNKAFEEHQVNMVVAEWEELVNLFAGVVVTLYSMWRLEKMFAGDNDAKSLLTSLNIDLDANPTPEMGHLQICWLY
jgi:hypothetical protein